MIATRDAMPADYEVYTRLHGELGSGDPVPGRERFGTYRSPPK